jgi:hypothetical protein
MVASSIRPHPHFGEGDVQFPFLCKPQKTGKIIANRPFLKRRQVECI